MIGKLPSRQYDEGDRIGTGAGDEEDSQDGDDLDDVPLCFICGLEFEEHALDYNIDLLYYNSML